MGYLLSFVTGAFVGMLIIALCAAAGDESRRRERDDSGRPDPTLPGTDTEAPARSEVCAGSDGLHPGASGGVGEAGKGE